MPRVTQSIFIAHTTRAGRVVLNSALNVCCMHHAWKKYEIHWNLCDLLCGSVAYNVALASDNTPDGGRWMGGKLSLFVERIGIKAKVAPSPSPSAASLAFFGSHQMRVGMYTCINDKIVQWNEIFEHFSKWTGPEHSRNIYARNMINERENYYQSLLHFLWRSTNYAICAGHRTFSFSLRFHTLIFGS